MRIKKILYEEKIVCSQPKGILSGKSVLIIGAGGGIGQNIAVSTRKAGASVILSGRKRNELINRMDLFEKKAFIECDVSQEISIYNMLQCIKETKNDLPDVIVNCAGVRSQCDAKGDFCGVREEEWDRTFTVNYKSNVYLANMYHEMLKSSKKEGLLIIISSIDGMKAAATPYGLSKSLLNDYIKSTGKIYDKNLKVLGIAPGPTATRMMNKHMTFTYYREDHPLRRCAVPQDIGNTAVFLMSSCLDFKSGTIIICDGGMLL